ncbi:MAG TPA: hypothetical protein VL979_06785 [Solirubrobacteraceae bacterium]|nr:hypothetical protein [Solirubrobacteraceae bacterium]
MKRSQAPIAADRLELLRWVVRMGAVTDEALALRQQLSLGVARARLAAARRAGLLARVRLLAGQPALYVASGAGLRASGLEGYGAFRVSPSGATHAVACARVAAALEHAYPDHRLMGERELRLAEREAGAALASAIVGGTGRGALQLHRPDMVLWPAREPAPAPVAVEVELTVKAPRRLAQICRAWARSRHVAGVVYLAAPEVMRPLARAIERAGAGERIALVAIEALPGGAPVAAAPPASTVPGDA